MWIKSPWCDQISDGERTFTVGNLRKTGNGSSNLQGNIGKKELGDGNGDCDSSSLSKPNKKRLAAVTLQEPYYLDDDSYASHHELDLLSSKEVHLTTYTAIREALPFTGLNISSSESEISTAAVLTTGSRFGATALALKNDRGVTVTEEKEEAAVIEVSLTAADVNEIKIGNDTSVINKNFHIAVITPIIDLSHLTLGLNNSTTISREHSAPSLSPPPWILDICLDYFSTLNPFLPELATSLEIDLVSFISVKNQTHSVNGNINNDEGKVRNNCEDRLEELGRDSTTISIPSLDDAISIIKNAFKHMKFRTGRGSGEYCGGDKDVRDVAGVYSDEGFEGAMEIMATILSPISSATLPLHTLPTLKSLPTQCPHPTTESIDEHKFRQEHELHTRYLGLYIDSEQHYASSFLSLLPLLSSNTRCHSQSCGGII